jgi:hypothetical protein
LMIKNAWQLDGHNKSYGKGWANELWFYYFISINSLLFLHLIYNRISMESE